MSDRKPSVLFVDDEEQVLIALRRLFIDEPYHVHMVSERASGHSSLRFARAVEEGDRAHAPRHDRVRLARFAIREGIVGA